MLSKYHPRHSRGYARHQRERARKRAEREWERMFGRGWASVNEKAQWTEKQREQWIARQAVDRKRCSCYVCTRSRRYVGPKLAEIKQVAAERVEDADLNSVSEEYPLGKHSNICADPDGWRDHEAFADPLRGVPECGLA